MQRLTWIIVLASLLLLDRGSPADAGEGLEALVGQQGRVQLSRGRDKICEMRAGLYNTQWTSAEATADPRGAGTKRAQRLRIAVPGGGTVNGEATISADANALHAAYVFTPDL